jgi:hypothetical protein
MARQYGNRGSNVTVILWYDEDGTVNLEAWSAAGTSGRPASHMTAADRVKVLEADGVPASEIITRTVRIQ